MTEYAKSDMAAELAWRDLRIAELERTAAELGAKLVSADSYVLVALAGAGICTPAEGFRKAGFNWAAHGIEELAKQRDEALARVAGVDESGRLLIQYDPRTLPKAMPRVIDFDRSEEATE